MWQILTAIPSLISGITAYLNKRQDVNLEKYKVDGKIDETLIRAEVAIIEAKASVLTHLSLAHYLFIVPTAIYYTLILIDAATEKLFPSVHWDVQALGGWAGWVSGMVVGFLFLNSAIGKYRR